MSMVLNMPEQNKTSEYDIIYLNMYNCARILNMPESTRNVNIPKYTRMWANMPQYNVVNMAEDA